MAEPKKKQPAKKAPAKKATAKRRSDKTDTRPEPLVTPVAKPATEEKTEMPPDGAARTIAITYDKMIRSMDPSSQEWARTEKALRKSIAKLPPEALATLSPEVRELGVDPSKGRPSAARRVYEEVQKAKKQTPEEGKVIVPVKGRDYEMGTPGGNVNPLANQARRGMYLFGRIPGIVAPSEHEVLSIAGEKKPKIRQGTTLDLEEEAAERVETTIDKAIASDLMGTTPINKERKITAPELEKVGTAESLKFIAEGIEAEQEQFKARGTVPGRTQAQRERPPRVLPGGVAGFTSKTMSGGAFKQYSVGEYMEKMGTGAHLTAFQPFSETAGEEPVSLELLTTHPRGTPGHAKALDMWNERVKEIQSNPRPSLTEVRQGSAFFDKDRRVVRRLGPNDPVPEGAFLRSTTFGTGGVQERPEVTGNAPEVGWIRQMGEGVKQSARAASEQQEIQRRLREQERAKKSIRAISRSQGSPYKEDL